MTYKKYFSIVQSQLITQLNEEEINIETSADLIKETVKSGGIVHVFGCGHSQMFAQELFYRAGGLVPVNALLIPHLSLNPKAKLSTFQERVEGFSQEYLDLIKTSKNDIMIIVSISGRNSAVIDMAIAAKSKGMKVISLSSVDFGSKITSRHSSGKLLKDFSDINIDIKCISGDAVLEDPRVNNKFCGTSTILGMTVLQSIIGETVVRLANEGFEVPVWISSNLDGGDEINAKFIRNYKDRIDCL